MPIGRPNHLLLKLRQKEMYATQIQCVDCAVSEIHRDIYEQANDADSEEVYL
jgi:hypothetical protein